MNACVVELVLNTYSIFLRAVFHVSIGCHLFVSSTPILFHPESVHQTATVDEGSQSSIVR